MGFTVATVRKEGETMTHLSARRSESRSRPSTHLSTFYVTNLVVTDLIEEWHGSDESSTLADNPSAQS